MSQAPAPSLRKATTSSATSARSPPLTKPATRPERAGRAIRSTRCSRRSPQTAAAPPRPTRSRFGSPALDKGNCFGCSLDGRLVTRPFDEPTITPATGGDNSDIGAFELHPHIVTNTNDAGAGSLRQALLDSSDGHTIFFAAALNGGTITLTTGELLVDKSVQILGPGADQLAVSGNNASRVFHIASGKTVTISGLTIRNGLASGARGGGIYNDHATLTLTNSTLSGNSAEFGGGIFNDGDAGSATLTVTDSTVSGNAANTEGGGMNNSA